ncbi:MAG: peptidylprolyl isomerase [Sedimentisphaeraceae bacterium JB056]
MTLTVNGEKIEWGVVEQEAERLRPHYEQVFAQQDKQHRDKQLIEWSKENVIERVLMKQQALDLDGDFAEETESQYQELINKSGGEDKFFAERGIDISEKQNLINDVELQVRIRHLIEKITSKAVQPRQKDIEEFYSENKERFTIPEMIRASHLVKHIGPGQEDPQIFEQMTQAKSELDQGADFAEVTAKYSDCADNGGDLGYYAKGKMVQDFEDATFDMEVGEVSDIFRTEFGFHIAKVTDKKSPRVCDLDEVRDYIVKQLEEQAKEKALEKFLDDKMKKAVIKEV